MKRGTNEILTDSVTILNNVIVNVGVKTIFFFGFVTVQELYLVYMYSITQISPSKLIILSSLYISVFHLFVIYCLFLLQYYFNLNKLIF